MIIWTLSVSQNSLAFESYFRNSDFQMTTESQDPFLSQIKPIIDKRCVTCHACREAECRLKMTSPEGIIRGGSKQIIHGGGLLPVKRTKLFHDAHGEDEWRRKGFYSVMKTPLKIERELRWENSEVDALGRNSLFTAAIVNSFQDGPYQEAIAKKELIGTDEQMCGSGQRNLELVPGMPYKMQQLSGDEFGTLYNWAIKGADADFPTAELLLTLTTPKNPELIKKWEDFFNTNTNKAKWTSRFLYEHLFLARFYFKESPGEFYELVRSSTPYPQAVKVSPTLKAYQKPKHKKWYYRMMKVHSTIVDKNHFVYEVNDETLSELKNMFWNEDWGKGNNNVSFNFKKSNPLVAFKHMSAKSRYTWMLKNAHLLLDISARSQNCRNEGAAAPYWDNMLHVFVKPESDPTVVFGKEFYDKAGKHLPIPNVTGGKISPFDNFNDEQRKYAKVKKVYAKKLHPKGLSLNDVWTGEEGKKDENAIITVLRHFWTASAHKGHWGSDSRSLLLLDFANFERYFYLCNVATEVSEAMLFQSRVVTYLFDVKKEAENNLLSLVPNNIRKEARKSLVEGLNSNYEFVNDFSLPYNQDNGLKNSESLTSYNDYIRAILEQRFSSEVLGVMSTVHEAGVRSENSEKTKLQNLRKIKGTFATQMPNISYLRVEAADGQNRFYSLAPNRYYKTRNQLSFTDKNYEKSQRSPERDVLDVFPGIHFTFPEKIYLVKEANLDQFLTDLQRVQTRREFLRFNDKYGLDQMATNFWEIIDEVNQTFIGNNPIDGGILDLHRYGIIDREQPL